MVPWMLGTMVLLTVNAGRLPQRSPLRIPGEAAEREGVAAQLPVLGAGDVGDVLAVLRAPALAEVGGVGLAGRRVDRRARLQEVVVVDRVESVAEDVALGARQRVVRAQHPAIPEAAVHLELQALVVTLALVGSSAPR